MIGIALGVMALIVVLSVMNGFVSQVRDRMLSVVSHVEIFANNGALEDWRSTERAVRRNPAVIAAAPYINAQALLTRGESVRGVLVRGIEPTLEPLVSDIGNEISRLAISDDFSCDLAGHRNPGLVRQEEEESWWRIVRTAASEANPFIAREAACLRPSNLCDRLGQPCR